jgi:hypothetical protein
MSWAFGFLPALSKKDGRTDGSRELREQVWLLSKIINRRMKAIILAAGKGMRLQLLR